MPSFLRSLIKKVTLGYISFKEICKLIFADKTWKQKINVLLIYVQFRLKRVHLIGHPFKLTIDPGNSCSLRCALCPTGTGASGRTRSFMDFSTFKKVIDELGEYAWAIDLFNWGEPLLNKDIFKMIEYARAKKIDVYVSTNLSKFSDEIGVNLIKSKLNLLCISLDGASQESVDQYQRGNNFWSVIANIRKLVDTKARLKSKTPLIQWRFLVNKYNEHEIEYARKLAKELKVDIFELGFFRCDTGIEIFLDSEAQFENIRPWLPVNEELSLYDYSRRQKKKIKEICWFLWTSTVIQPNGSVSPCCAVWPEKYDFGNINKTSFSKMWNGKKYQDARSISRGDSVSDHEHICYICKSNKAII